MIFDSTLPVCSAENVSVEKSASTQSQRSVGIHARKLRGNTGETGCWTAGDDKGRSCLFQPVVGSFTRDDYVMHMALAQSGAADADEFSFLLQFRNGPGAAIPHAGAHTAHKLVNHFRQCAAIRHAA